VSDKIKIAHQVIICQESNKDIALEHRVSRHVIQSIVKKARKNQNFLNGLVNERTAKREKRNRVAGYIREMNSKETFLDSIAATKRIIQEDYGMEADLPLIRSVMYNEAGMRYRKIKSCSIHINSQKNLVLRQQFALKFLELLQSKKVFLNVDETWLGMSDFRRQKWRAHGTTNSVPQLQLNPRISMITGLDSEGKIYLSLLQSNSNSKVMEIFFRQLVKKLDRERRNWRRDTVIILDNAPYHTSGASLKIFEDLNLPLLFTGPHSYDAAPCELLFAAFKSRDINPRHVQMGKR